MAGGKRGGGDRILESRHLVGLFLGVVLLCGVFFTLGYVMGRTQFGGPVHADVHPNLRGGADDSSADARDDTRDDARDDTNTEASNRGAERSAATHKPADAGASPSPAPSEWDFYAKKDNDHLEPAVTPPPGDPSEPPANKAPAANPSPAVAPQPALTPVKTTGRSTTARNTKNSIVLQVAALRHQSDALAMAELLQKKRFPAFVATPVSGNALYRVQVGPYTDGRAADAAKAALDRAGFKAIVKR